ncbi:MAG TPA: flagellar assembly protein FliW [Terriglobia bacterium]|jgi:flagellar assembly factor FliW
MSLEPGGGSSVPDGDAIIHFDEGLVGFSECKDFRMLANPEIAPFHLLQMACREDIGFMVIDPALVMPDYYTKIPAREWETIGIAEGDPRMAFTICIVGKEPRQATGNFQAPLIVNHKKMIGRQLILTDLALSVRHPLV